MNKDEEIRAKALELAIAMVAALPDNEKMKMLNRSADLTAEQVIAVEARRIAELIRGPTQESSDNR